MEKRLSKRAMIRLYSFAIAFVLVLVGVGALAINDALFYRNQLEMGYLQSLGDLSNHTTEITRTLTKGIYSATPTQLSLLSASLWRDSAGAKQALSNIPYAEHNLDSAYRFYSQVGDYAMSLTRKTHADPSLGNQDLANLEMLLDYSQKISQEIQTVESRVRNGEISLLSDKYMVGTGTMTVSNKGSVRYNELSLQNVSTKETTPNTMEGLEQVKSYATLIYDGPFSDHMLDRTPLYTKDMSEISREDAKKIAQSLWQKAGYSAAVKAQNDPTGRKSSSAAAPPASSSQAPAPTFENNPKTDARGENYPIADGFSLRGMWDRWAGEPQPKPLSTGLQATDDENSLMPLYCFETDSVYLGITKKGGIPATYSVSREIKEATISPEDSVKAASSFLEQIGFKNMKSTYYEESGGICTTNFAYTADNITFYPDLIKVGIALDTGEVVFLDARSFISNHHKRDLSTNLIAESTAKETAGRLVKIGETKLAVIPTRGGSETLCYEISATGNRGHHLLIYVNALNGIEEQLLILIQTPGGVMTS